MAPKPKMPESTRPDYGAGAAGDQPTDDADPDCHRKNRQRGEADRKH
jgi:hypothetical protein